MITLNEAHSIEGALESLKGWAREVFLVDSFSRDATVDIALKHGVHVVQHAFRGFGDQWNFALRTLPITAPWTMKLDPDERLTNELKQSIRSAIDAGDADALAVDIRLWFMQRRLPVSLSLTRVWRTGMCQFTDVSANEHAVIKGRTLHVAGEIQHHDSPDLHHWLDKQNRYTTAEAVAAFRGEAMAAAPRLLGTHLERRMWLKRHYAKLPFRYVAMFLYNYVIRGAFRAGWVGYAWSRLRSDVYRMTAYKLREMRITNREPTRTTREPGHPDPRIKQY